MAIITLQYFHTYYNTDAVIEYDDVLFQVVSGTLLGSGEIPQDPDPYAGHVLYQHTSGAYQYTVKSAVNWPYANVSQQSAPGINITGQVTNPTNVTNGAISLTVSGGAGGYTYLWADGATTKDRTGLSAGSYTITVTDSNGTTASKTFNLQNQGVSPFVLTYNVTNISGPDQTDGKITLSVTGGSGNFSYGWADGPTSRDRNNLAAGFYTVTVLDTGTGQSWTENNIEVRTPGFPEPRERVFSVSDVNSLRFVIPNDAAPCDSGFTPSGQLYCQEKHYGTHLVPYWQKVQNCDTLRVQFRSNYSSHTLQVINYQTGAVLGSYGYTQEVNNLGRFETFPAVATADGFEQTRVYPIGADFPIEVEANDTLTLLNVSYLVQGVGFDSNLQKQYALINLAFDSISTGPELQTEATLYYNAQEYDVFEASIPFQNLGQGFRQVIIYTDGGPTAYSEPIELAELHPETVLMEWQNRDSGFDLSYATGYKGRMRVEAHLYKRLPKPESTTFRSNLKPVKLTGHVQRRFLFETYQLPPYLHEKLALIFEHDKVWINGQEYVSEEGYGEPDYQERALLANAECIIEQVDWMGRQNGDDGGSDIDNTAGLILQLEGGFIKIL
jgi:hypothetical protein